MRNGLLLLAGIGLLAGCSMEVPGFVGREGQASGTYSFRREAPPEPRPIFLREAVAERALHGVIVRVEGEAPTQGYYSAILRPIGSGPDAAGLLSFELVAVPPGEPEAVGPARTRTLTAAIFVPNLALKDLRGFRVAGSGAVQTLPLR
jgi:hypothetical protein